MSCPDVFVINKTIDMIKELVGKNGPVTINTGIYARDSEYQEEDPEVFDPENDIIEIGKEGKRITIRDIEKLMSHIKSQFNTLEKNNFGYSYFFEGIKYNKKSDMYEFYFGS